MGGYQQPRGNRLVLARANNVTRVPRRCWYDKCANAYVVRSNVQRFCSPTCKDRYYREEYRERCNRHGREAKRRALARETLAQRVRRLNAMRAYNKTYRKLTMGGASGVEV